MNLKVGQLLKKELEKVKVVQLLKKVLEKVLEKVKVEEETIRKLVRKPVTNDNKSLYNIYYIIMKLELFIFAIVAFLLYNLYYDGKYEKSRKIIGSVIQKTNDNQKLIFS